MKKGIKDLAKKVRAIERAVSVAYKKPLEAYVKEKHTEGRGDIENIIRNINRFKKENINNPRLHTFDPICKILGIDRDKFNLPDDEFLKHLACIFKIPVDNIKEKDEERYIGSSRLGKEKGLSFITKHFEDDLSGYWVCIHYWEKNTGDYECVTGSENTKKVKSEKEHRENRSYIFRHLLHMCEVNKETKEIKIQLASARNQTRGWNYKGNMSISDDKKYYFFLETTTNRINVEVLMVIATPLYQDCSYLSGIMLASTEPNQSTKSRPAASRILLKKIAEKASNEKDLFEKYIGIYPDSCFNEEVRLWIDNKFDENVLFSKFDDQLEGKLKKIEREHSSLLACNRQGEAEKD